MKVKTLLFLLLASFHLTAQEFLIVDYYNLPLYLNPAETGKIESNRLQMGMVVEDLIFSNFQDYFISFDKKIALSEKDNFGVGAFLSFSGGPKVISSYSKLMFSGAYSRTVFQNARSKHYLNAGFNFGIGRNAIDDDVIWGTGGKEDYNEVVIYPDFGIGLSYNLQLNNGSNFEIGAGIFHLNEPKLAFLIDSDNRISKSGRIHARISQALSSHFSINLNAFFIQQGQRELFTTGAALSYQFEHLPLELLLGGDLFYGNDLHSGIDHYAFRIGFKTNRIGFSGAFRQPLNGYPGNIYDLILSYTFGKAE